MKINHLKVEAFRNIRDVSLSPCDTVNIICGDNAQGKTNILESMWLFTGAKTFRSAKEKDFIPKTSDTAGIIIDFESEDRDQQSVIRWQNNKKLVSLNGVKKTSTSAFNGIFTSVVFTPDHLSLIKEGPEHRRNMIDISLSQAYPKYNKALINYQKALKQRNTLLKDLYYNSSLIEILPVWDEHVINYGAYITLIRSRYIAKLSSYAHEIYSGISGNKEKLAISYSSSLPEYKSDMALEEIKDLIKESLNNTKQEDIRTGSTGIGPHRDDLEIEINDLPARAFGSQGQQRSSILALKLAECKILEEQTGQKPVVMLDDVMSELDNHRKHYLLNKLKDKQVFITCCDTSAFSELEEGRIFYIKDGKLIDQQEV